MTRPVSIKRSGEDGLAIVWDDAQNSFHSLRDLRDNCPCAGCRGETVLLRTYSPPPQDLKIPGRYNLVGIHEVGSYAVQLVWADGHATGIYSWQFLIAQARGEHARNS